MVQVPEARKVIRRDLSVQDFLDPLHHTLAQVLMGEDVPAETLRERLAGTESVELLMQLLFEPIGAEEKDKEKVLAEYVRFLQRLVPAEEERRRLSRAIEEAQAAGDEAGVRRLQMVYQRLVSAGATGGFPGKGGEEHGQEEGAGAGSGN